MVIQIAVKTEEREEVLLRSCCYHIGYTIPFVVNCIKELLMRRFEMEGKSGAETQAQASGVKLKAQDGAKVIGYKGLMKAFANLDGNNDGVLQLHSFESFCQESTLAPPEVT